MHEFFKYGIIVLLLILALLGYLFRALLFVVRLPLVWLGVARRGKHTF